MTKINYNKFFKNIFLAIFFASLINIFLAFLGRNFSHTPVTFGPYMYSPVISLTAIGVIFASFGYLILLKFFKDINKSEKWFYYIGIILTLISFLPDIMMPWSSDTDQVGWTLGSIFNLMLMHIVAIYFIFKYILKKENLNK
jgi:H+/Cl- antiporter ClcA